MRYTKLGLHVQSGIDMSTEWDCNDVTSLITSCTATKQQVLVVKAHQTTNCWHVICAGSSLFNYARHILTLPKCTNKPKAQIPLVASRNDTIRTTRRVCRVVT